MDDQQLLTPEQVGDRLQLSVYTILDYLRHGHPKGGKLRGFKSGKQWRIREADLQAFIEANLSNGESNGERRADLKPPTPHPRLVPSDRQQARKAAIMPRLHAMQAEGLSHQKIANELNAEGVPTLSGRGRGWTAGVIGKLLAETSVQDGGKL
jgi:excisionase family DNA binding protein